MNVSKPISTEQTEPGRTSSKVVAVLIYKKFLYIIHLFINYLFINSYINNCNKIVSIFN